MEIKQKTGLSSPYKPSTPPIHPPSLYPSIFHPSVMPTSPFIKSPTDASIHLSLLPPSILTFVLIHPTQPSIHPPTHLPIHILTHPSTPVHLSIHPPAHPSVHPSTHSLVIILPFSFTSFHQSSTATYPINLPAYPTAQTSLFPPPVTHQSSQLCSKSVSQHFPFLLPSPNPSSQLIIQSLP